MYIDETPVTFQ